MKDIIQTSSEATRSFTSSPLIFSRGPLQPTDLSSLLDGLSTACLVLMSIYIFLIYHIYYLCCLCIDFYNLSACWGCWFVVYIRMLIYKVFNVIHFDYTVVVGREKVWPGTRLTTPVGWL